VPDAVVQLRREGRDVAWWPCAPAGGDAHAGRTETALLLALAPAAVRPEAAEPGATVPLAELLPALRAGGVAAVSPNGVLGDPSGATAAEGGRLLAEMSAALRAGLTRWHPDRTGRLT
jgi:creatinine amidohydrolase/Fe(II)-dependent formamide hydrolase-like protein